MRLTVTHLRYWQERKAAPKWLARVKHPGRVSVRPPVADVDRCINEHADLRIAYVGLEAGNTMALLRMKMKRVSLMEAMVDLHAVTENKKRRAFLTKWIKRVMARRKELSCTS